MLNNTEGGNNTACGRVALKTNTTGSTNTATGNGALFFNTTGSGNIALGESAGAGVSKADNVIAIGADGENVSGTCYIGNIFGVTSANGIGVLVNANGKLGTTTSSRRFKEEIKPMDQVSEALFALKPVSFHYKKDIDPAGTSQLGLVAEDVEKVNPDLVVRDKEGNPYGVRYDQVNAMLLNEFLKEHRRVEELNSTVATELAAIADLKSTVAQQQKRMEVLTARLNEQAAQIQKVSAQLETNKPAPQVVNNP